MRTAKTLRQNRREKKEWTRRLQSEDPGLEVVHPPAAGIDVGNSAHYVAVRPDRDPEPVRRFVFYGGPVPVGGLVEKLWREHRSHAIDRGVVDSSIRHSGRTGF
jgi:hypothetical protein